MQGTGKARSQLSPCLKVEPAETGASLLLVRVGVSRRRQQRLKWEVQDLRQMWPLLSHPKRGKLLGTTKNQLIQAIPPCTPSQGNALRWIKKPTLFLRLHPVRIYQYYRE